jgi:hypothetical protein
MKTDVKGCSACPVGKESFESFYSRTAKKNLVQYDYRHTDGELFTCVTNSLESARTKRNLWLEKKANSVLGMYLPELSTKDICEEITDLKHDLAVIEEFEKKDIPYSELVFATNFRPIDKPKIIEGIQKLTEEKLKRNN